MSLTLLVGCHAPSTAGSDALKVLEGSAGKVPIAPKLNVSQVAAVDRAFRPPPSVDERAVIYNQVDKPTGDALLQEGDALNAELDSASSKVETDRVTGAVNPDGKALVRRCTKVALKAIATDYLTGQDFNQTVADVVAACLRQLFPGIASMSVMQVTDYLIGVIDPYAVRAQQISGRNNTVFDEWIALSAGA